MNDKCCASSRDASPVPVSWPDGVLLKTMLVGNAPCGYVIVPRDLVGEGDNNGARLTDDPTSWQLHSSFMTYSKQLHGGFIEASWWLHGRFMSHYGAFMVASLQLQRGFVVAS